MELQLLTETKESKEKLSELQLLTNSCDSSNSTQQINQHPLSAIYVHDAISSQKSEDWVITGQKASSTASSCIEFHSIDAEQLLDSFNERFATMMVTTWNKKLVDKLISPLQRYLQGRVFGGPNDASLLPAPPKLRRRNSEEMYPPNLYFNQNWYLEAQNKLQCWKHTLSSILGIILPADICTSNWFTSLITQFIHLKEDVSALLDGPGIGEFDSLEQLVEEY